MSWQRRLAETDVSSKESRNFATEATEAGRRVETKLNLLEAKLAESQSQQLALEALYQELTRNRDEVTLEEVEQLLLIANQQLQLASNVKAALIAMQEADARLQRIDRPQLSPCVNSCKGHGSAESRAVCGYSGNQSASR